MTQHTFPWHLAVKDIHIHNVCISDTTNAFTINTVELNVHGLNDDTLAN